MAYVKDPSAKLDYAIDWSGWLSSGETITTSTWTVPSGITEATPAPSTADGLTTIWLSGGTAGTEYLVTNHIVTNQGREDDRSFVVNVQDR